MTDTLSIRWRPRQGVTLTRSGERALVIDIKGSTEGIRMETPSTVVTDALMRLADGADEAALLDALGGRAGDLGTAAALHYTLGRLRHYGLLEADLWCDGGPMATLAPRVRDFDPTVPVNAAGPWRLSRFAYLRRDGDSLILECPEAPCVLRTAHAGLIAWLAEAARPVTPEPGSSQAEVMALLGSFGFLVDADRGETDAQRTWEFHDRLFHRKARFFDDFQPHGGTYRFRGEFPSAPAIRPAYEGETVTLPEPTGDRGRTLLDVMEARRSRRDMDDAHPVSLDQVAELLHRVARVTETLESREQDCLRRPFPSGGAIHELEFYLAVHACDGLTPGFYHYRGADHALTRIEGAHQPAADMLADCAVAWGQPARPPQCLMVVTSRLPRLAWKYEGIAYKISLLNAGVVLQSLYLVCTEIGLAGSAAGSGQPKLFQAATGVGPWEETSIAEFGFGTPPEG